MNLHFLVKIFIAILFAYLLANFCIGPMFFNKLKKNWLRNLTQSIIYGLFAYLILANWLLWYVPVILCTTLFFFNLLLEKKSKILLKFSIADFFKKPNNSERFLPFISSQCLNITIIVLSSFWIYSFDPTGPEWFSALNGYSWIFVVLLCALFLLIPFGGILIGDFIEQFNPHKNDPPETLNNTGKYIGFIERLLVLVFIIVQKFDGVGFLIAAKSLYRFGSAKNDMEKKETEYYFIGTFSSILFAILVGWAALQLII